MPVRHKVSATLLLLACGALALPALARAGLLVELDNIRKEKLFVSGFILDDQQTVDIEAVGFRYGNRRGGADSSPAWILDAETRSVVWRAREAESKRGSRQLREYRDSVQLPAGKYEVYYSSYPQPWDGWRVDGIGDIISRVVRPEKMSFNDRDFEAACGDFYIRVEGEGRTFNADEIMAGHEKAGADALISAVQLERNHYESLSVTLDREMELAIYAVGEMDRDGAYDCSWIVNTDTNERVWKFDYRNSEPAGGAKKNRRIKEVLTLPAGNYALFCVTDDSHCFGKWNSAPPHDPFYYGVTVHAADPGMRGHAKIGEYENIEPDAVIVELVELGDSDHKTKGFTLNQHMRLRVYAIGEGEKDAMHDYSWIVDADTRETVWEMKYYDSEHAGGAAKNRVVDEIIELDAGNYIAYAATDGSHSYRDWNASAPYDKKRWGLTISSADGSRPDVRSFEDRADASVLAQLVGIGDDARERTRFTLDRDSEVRVYALGEGEGKRMYDLAWIEDDGGRVVWEMSYRQTEHAGGARKNRVFNDTIKLDRGEYTVHYESDGSHSFAGWNGKPPKDRWSWGVTIRAVE